MSYNYNYIEYVLKVDDRYNIKQVKSTLSHYNYVHCGVGILSMSKNIMDCVFDCGNDCNINIYYQYTYSTHLNYDDVDTDVNIYKYKYIFCIFDYVYNGFLIMYTMNEKRGNYKRSLRNNTSDLHMKPTK